MEQLQSVTSSGANGISSFTVPQWQDDSIMVHRQVIEVPQLRVLQLAAGGKFPLERDNLGVTDSTRLPATLVLTEARAVNTHQI